MFCVRVYVRTQTVAQREIRQEFTAKTDLLPTRKINLRGLAGSLSVELCVCLKPVLQQAVFFYSWGLGGIPKGGKIPRKWRNWWGQN